VSGIIGCFCPHFHPSDASNKRYSAAGVGCGGGGVLAFGGKLV